MWLHSRWRVLVFWTKCLLSWSRDYVTMRTVVLFALPLRLVEQIVVCPTERDLLQNAAGICRHYSATQTRSNSTGTALQRDA